MFHSWNQRLFTLCPIYFIIVPNYLYIYLSVSTEIQNVYIYIDYIYLGVYFLKTRALSFVTKVRKFNVDPLLLSNPQSTFECYQPFLPFPLYP